MRDENAAGVGWDSGWGGYESSVPGVRLSRVGNPGRKSSFGKRSRSLEYIADTNLEKTSVSADELQVPSGIFFSLLPHRQVMAGTEDAKVSAILNHGLRPLICSISSNGEGIVEVTEYL